MSLEQELKRWEKLRGALRIDEREVFQDMMDESRRHASAAGAGAFPSKTEGMLLFILSACHETLKELLKQRDRTESNRPISGTALRQGQP